LASDTDESRVEGSVEFPSSGSQSWTTGAGHASLTDWVAVALVSVMTPTVIYTLLKTGPALQYEASIYSAYEPWFWACYYLVVVAGSWIYFSSGQWRTRHFIVVLLVCIQLLQLSMPFFRGYFLYGRADPLVHLGRTRDILLYRHVGKVNFYPIMHIAVAELEMVGGVPLRSISLGLPALFWLVLLFGFYVFVRGLMGSELAEACVVGWSFLPLGAWHERLVGNMLSYDYVFVLLGASVLRAPKAKKVLLVALGLVGLVFFHPLTSVYLLAIALIAGIGASKTGDSAKWVQFSPFLAAAVLVVWIRWYIIFPVIRNTIRLFWLSLLEPSGNPFLKMYLDNVARYNIALGKLLNWGFHRYFGTGFFVLVSFLPFRALSRDLPRSVSMGKLMMHGRLFRLLVIAFGMWAALSTVVFIVNFERVSRYIVAFALPLAVCALFARSLAKKILTLFAVGILGYFAVFAVHSSPLSGSYNDQVTRSEYSGLGWLFENRNESISIYDDGVLSNYRFYETLYGCESAMNATGITYYGRGRSYIPEEFGYNRSLLAGGAITSPAYYVLGVVALEFYRSTIPERIAFWRWKPWNYARLAADPTVNRIYSSPEVVIYRVTPLQEKMRNVRT